MANYIRSAETTTAVSYSRAELEKAVTRYGCRRFGTETDSHAGVIRVWFTVPDHKAGTPEWIPVRLEIRLATVRERLAALMQSREWKVKRKAGTPSPEQVERVAWRHVVLLVQAGLEAAEAGVKPVSEFFLADTVMEDSQGRAGRLVDMLGHAVPEWRALLALPKGGTDAER